MRHKSNVFEKIQERPSCKFRNGTAAIWTLREALMSFAVHRDWRGFSTSPWASPRCVGDGDEMIDSELTVAMVAAWARRNLPARLTVVETAKLLGFAEHDIPILMAARKLTPLGDPAPNAPKWFAAVEIVALATDKDWLNKATKEVSKYWRYKRSGDLRRVFSLGVSL